MDFGKYKKSESFIHGLGIPSSGQFETAQDILYEIKRRYGGEEGTLEKDEKEAIIGAAACYFLQGHRIPAILLLQESGIDERNMGRHARRVLEYAEADGQRRIAENSRQVCEEEDTFTEDFLKKIGVKPTR